MPGRRPLWRRILDAIVHPERWDQTPSAPEPPAPPPARKAPAKKAPTRRITRGQVPPTPAKKTVPRPPPKKTVPRPPAPVRTRITPRNLLPAEWGPNEVGLWQDATKINPQMSLDWQAQAYYDAALYTFSETTEVRAAILERLFTHIQETYGVDFRRIFDWAGYREAYDTVALSHGGDFATGGDGRN